MTNTTPSTSRFPIRAVLVAALLGLSVLSLMVGVRNISFAQMDALWWETMLISRLPRLLSIIITGASISTCGLIMQSITQNKFVSPTTAGTNEWCKLGILIAILFLGQAPSLVKMACAFVFALGGTFIFTTILGRMRVKNVILVPLIGMMLGSVVSALTTFIAYRYDLVQNMTSWMQGNFALIVKGRYELLYLGIPALVIAYIYADRFTIAGMGKGFATNLGLNHARVMTLGLTVVAFVSALVTVTVGSIPFLGLIIPNIVTLYRGDNIKNSLPETVLLGSVFVLACDILSRVIIFPYEISISVTVSVIGSIILLFLILRRKNGYNG